MMMIIAITGNGEERQEWSVILLEESRRGREDSEVQIVLRRTKTGSTSTQLESFSTSLQFQLWFSQLQFCVITKPSTPLVPFWMC